MSSKKKVDSVKPIKKKVDSVKPIKKKVEVQPDFTVGFIVTNNQILVTCGDQRGTIDKGNAKHKQALEAILKDDMETLKDLALPSHSITNYSKLEMYVEKGVLHRRGAAVEPTLAKVIMQLKDTELPYLHLLNFWDRLALNPESSSVSQLYTFIEANGIQITEEGMIMGYKSVAKNMRDHHSGTVRYDLHTTVVMDRARVVCDPKTGCGPGLHFGSHKYATSTYDNDRSVLLEVLVDPADVVSVPIDCSFQKCRTCKLFVAAISDGKKKTSSAHQVDQSAKKALGEKFCKKPLSTSDETATFAPAGSALAKETKKMTKQPASKKAVSPKKMDKPVAIPVAIKKVSTPKNQEKVKIGNYFYDRNSVDSKKVDEKMNDKVNPFKQLVKSDYPKFFADLKVDTLARQRNGKTSDYIAGVKNVYILYTLSAE